MALAAQLTEADPGDARSAVRRTLRLHTPAHSSRGAAAALIHDLSERGLKIEVAARLVVDEIIGVELPEAGLVEARIAWVGGGFAGCRFVQTVPRSAVSAALLRSPAAPLGVPAREQPELPMIGVVEQPPAERAFVDTNDWPAGTSAGLTLAALAMGLVIALSFVLILLVLALS